MGLSGSQAPGQARRAWHPDALGWRLSSADLRALGFKALRSFGCEALGLLKTLGFKGLGGFGM